jgi:DNA-binding NtrC family response regulator
LLKFNSDLPAQRLTTLLVSPSSGEHAALGSIFSRSNWNLRSASNCQEALTLLAREPIPVVICDRDLPDGSWRTLLENTHTLRRQSRIIISSHDADDRLSADVLRSGGYDLLTLPWETREVRRVIALAWRSWESTCLSSAAAAG